MTDSKYFTTTKKGEIFELKSELNSDKKEKKREAVKKVNVNYHYTYIIFLNIFTYKLKMCTYYVDLYLVLCFSIHR